MSGWMRLIQGRAGLCVSYLLPIIAAIPFLFSYVQTIVITPASIAVWNASAPGPHYAYYAKLPVPPFGLVSAPDSANTKSTLMLSEDAVPLPLVHSLHMQIMEKGSGRYSHWGLPREDFVIFSASDSGDPRTSGRTFVAQRPLSLAPWLVSAFLAGCLLSAFCLKYFRNRDLKLVTVQLMRRDLPLFLATLVLLPAAILLVADVSATSHPILSQWLLKNCGPALSFVAYQFPNFLLGTAVAWLATEWLWFRRKLTLTHNSLPLMMVLLLCSVSYFFILIDGQRLGAILPTYDSLSIGLLQFSDAAGYVACSLDALAGVEFDSFCQRRPYAAGMRLLLSNVVGPNLYLSLMLQAAGLAGATILVFVLLERFVSVPAGFLFCGFVLLHTRPFAGTALTEMIGAFFSVLSAGALLSLWKREKATSNLIATVALTTLAQFVRMGALLTIPAMVFAAAITSFQGKWSRAVIGLGLALTIVIAVASGSVAFNKLYGDGSGEVGGNFSYVIAGISLGGDWSTSARVYHDELSNLTLAKEVSGFLYHKAYLNIVSNPTPALKYAADEYRLFFSGLSNYAYGGYPHAIQSENIYVNYITSSVILLMFVVGCIRFISIVELSTIILYISGILLSVPFIMSNDGWRVSIVSTIMTAFFAAYVLKSPSEKRARV